MTHESAPRRHPLHTIGWSASILLSFSVATAAQAGQVAPRIEIRGQVTPRCWAAPAVPNASSLSTGQERLDTEQAPPARCSQGRLPLAIEVRDPVPAAPGSEQGAVRPASASDTAAPQAQARPAREIVVSPTP